MKKKTDIQEAIKVIGAMAKLIKAAKCYNCIHRYEAKLKKKKDILVNAHPGETILSKSSLRQLEKQIKKAK